MTNSAVWVSVLLLLLLTLSESSPLKGCCTRYHETPIPLRALKNYKIQDITEYCNIKAIIFRTVRNRLVCANPDNEWVLHAMETVPEKL